MAIYRRLSFITKYLVLVIGMAILPYITWGSPANVNHSSMIAFPEGKFVKDGIVPGMWFWITMIWGQQITITIWYYRIKYRWFFRILGEDNDDYNDSYDDPTHSLFVLTQWGKTCGSGGLHSNNIDTEYECRRIVVEIEGRFSKPGDGGEVYFVGRYHDANMPKGCYMWKNYGVWWNSHKRGRAWPEARSICKMGWSK